MLKILEKLLGPHRAVSFYMFLQNRGMAIALVLAFTAILGMIIVSTNPARQEHVGYLIVDVLGVEPLNNDEKIGVIVSVQLPDGMVLKLTETEGAISGAIVDKACLEQRRSMDDDTYSYRLRRPHRCEPEA